jgi:hypothetical protein
MSCGKSRKTWKNVWGAVGLIALLALGSAGCQQEEGPLEKAGRQLDEAAEEVADKARELAGEGPMERFGRKLDRAAGDVKEAVHEAGESIEEEFGK